MMVVPVFITNCHVSLNLKIGPVMIHSNITATAKVNVLGRPQKREVAFAKLAYQDDGYILFFSDT